VREKGGERDHYLAGSYIQFTAAIALIVGYTRHASISVIADADSLSLAA